MCLNPKLLIKNGHYKETNYNGKQGEKYNIVAYTHCGHCEQCTAEKANNWVVRNYYEEKAHQKKCFLTLTYKENTLFLVKKDLQDFIKRLRRYIDYHNNKEKIKIRYFACGEYGTRTNRPHFHIIIYGWQDDQAEFIKYNKKLQIVKKSKIIEKLWNKGITSYQEYNTHEIPYISLYNTASDTEKHAFIMKRETAKILEKELKNNKDQTSRINMIKQLDKLYKKALKDKEEYITIKEFNTWSTAIGWKEWLNQYKQGYIFTEYIEDKEYHTPTTWVKKLANKQLESEDKTAIKEMLRRVAELTANLDIHDKAEENKTKQRHDQRQTKLKLDWAEKGEQTEL